MIKMISCPSTDIEDIMEMLIGKTGLYYAYTTQSCNICNYCIWQEICQEQPKEKCKDYESGEE